MRWGIFFSYFIEVHLFSLVGRSKPRSILFSTDFNGFSCWDLCSQKWCNFLLITLKFSTENWMIFYWSQLNSLLIITKHSTILEENALFSTMCSQIFYCLRVNFLLSWPWFHLQYSGDSRLAKKGDKAAARRAQNVFIDRDCFTP